MPTPHRLRVAHAVSGTTRPIRRAATARAATSIIAAATAQAETQRPQRKPGPAVAVQARQAMVVQAPTASTRRAERVAPAEEATAAGPMPGQTEEPAFSPAAAGRAAATTTGLEEPAVSARSSSPGTI